MNTNNLKKYAPQARNEFIEAVSKRLNQFGIHADSKGKLTISTPVVSGSVMQIEGLSFDACLARAREKLVQRAEQMGFEQLVEQMAYTWFNRLSAIRFMELHGYLEHNLRVLSHPEKANGFEILDHAQDVATDLGLNRNHIVELKLAGNKDEALYRTLLLGQCHQLHQAMPFLFEALDDETELLLPDNLTRTDSILRGLVDSIPEDDWQHVEIIGWLYQFYISEKKDQVIGSVVKSEDIPAATQLFTPNWIVKYLVQNSVGRQWLMTYPDSGLKAQMEYYIEPAEQEPSVIEALAAITPASIDPETLKVLDPACGSGHILVEAYDILKAIYEERGYRVRDIPKLILEKNLYGLDIDDRAAQLAGFALMMKAREDDRRIFTRDIKLNVLAIQSSQNLDLHDLWRKLALNQDAKRGSMESIFDDVQSHLADTVDDIEFKQLRSILALFEQAKTLGSLIQVPQEQAEFLRNLTSQLQALIEQGDTMQKPAAMALLPYVHQAWVLAQQYDAVVANPPYMGGKGMNAALKEFAKKQFSDSKSDMFAMFIEQGFKWCKPNGFNSMVTMQSWMFLSSYESMRERLLKEHTLSCMVHMGNGVMGIAFGTAATIFKNQYINNYAGSFSYCDNEDLNDNGIPAQFPVQNERLKTTKPDDFKKISGSPVAYWVSEEILNAFKKNPAIENYSTFKQGMATSDNERFLRFWQEINFQDSDLNCNSPESLSLSPAKWYPYNKGGSYRKWYGNNEYFVNWKNDGEEMKAFTATLPQGTWVRLKSREYYCLPNITYSGLSSGEFGCRLSDAGFLFDTKGSCIFSESENRLFELSSFLNSKVNQLFLKILCPTLDYSMVGVKKSPIIIVNGTANIARKAKDLAKLDWNNYETSWHFSLNPLVRQDQNALKTAFGQWQTQNQAAFAEMQRLEEENNRLFIEAYGLQDELSSEVPEAQITLTRTDQEKDSQRLISYAIGCMMGRYSLDEPGLIYAHAGNVDFDPSRYPSFPADEDGILPLTDQEWFKDDATNRFREFLLAVWGEDTLHQNLEFVAESLTLGNFKAKKGETSLDTVRRYLSSQFYKDHLQTYKKRPIYWLFSSGKQKAFECLVYLHRYNDSTLARMRTEYVTPLLGKYSAYAEQLNQQLQDASSAEATRIKKEQQTLEKKQAELRQFDDKLKHYADMRIKLDLDDGVKVNYGKFGDLLAEVKAVTGVLND
jgi:type II restriction/modification system DNA methylase subunit YeeA